MDTSKTDGNDRTRMAKEVRQFYDLHPYPPPVEDLEEYRRIWRDPLRRRADFHLFWPTVPYKEEWSLLIAGCGTAQAAKHALRWPGARVTGIDVSSTSLRHTKELKDRYGLENLELCQLSVERAAELGRAFDQIVCTGVLHHLPDPDAGLRALATVLEPGGAMQIMVYAPFGRSGIYMLQEYCRRLGIQASSPEIRDLALTLRALPPSHPLTSLLRDAPDFRNEAALADALLHPCDRAYSVPQFLEFLERNGLKFGRWVRQAPYLPQCGGLAATPHASRLTRLPEREQYAAVELFRGTIRAHSAVIYGGGRRNGRRPIRFDGPEWRDYVPIRLPHTICVEERLPPGAAGVLINRGHTHTDLYLPISPKEKRVFEAIDGKRTTAAAVREARLGDPEEQAFEATRAFLERLWWYDQIVFDASGCG